MDQTAMRHIKDKPQASLKAPFRKRPLCASLVKLWWTCQARGDTFYLQVPEKPRKLRALAGLEAVFGDALLASSFVLLVISSLVTSSWGLPWCLTENLRPQR